MQNLALAIKRRLAPFDINAGDPDAGLWQDNRPQSPVLPRPQSPDQSAGIQAAPPGLPNLPRPAQSGPITRSAQSPTAMTLFQGGMTPRPYEIQPDPPPARSSANKIRETIANQIRYEDIAPKLEEVRATPGFKPKDKYGFVDKLKMALGGAALGNQRGGGLGAIGGIIAGLVNPEGVDRAGYAAYVKPQYDAETQAATGRNKAKLDAFTQEIKNREAISKINQETRGKYQQMTGGAQLVMFNDATGEYYPVTVDGEPVEHPSIPVGRGHDTTQKIIEGKKIKAAWDRLNAEMGGRKEIAQMNNDFHRNLAEFMQREAMKRLGITESGQDRRLRTKLKAEGYDLGEGVGTGAGTSSARPGGGSGTGTTENPANLLERLRRFEDENEERDDWWH